MTLDDGALIDGKYRIEGRLGQGGMGVVFRARQLNLDRAVAIKVLAGDARPSALERFRREALAVARLRHPNIVTVHDFGDDSVAGSYIVLELLEGRPLDAELARRRALNPVVAVAIATQVCAALSAAHAAGIVHRDLKPSNVFLEDGRRGLSVKVLDFGIAKLRDPGEPGSGRVTAAGVVLGTPIYMSPEQCEGREVDARSDVYSLGCVLYEMLAGRPPFVADSFVALAHKHTSEAPRPPGELRPGIPPALDAVVLRALAKRRRDRFASADELAAALAAVVGDGAAEPTADGAGVTLDLRVATAVGDEGGRTLAHSSGAEQHPEPANNLRSEVTHFVGRVREVAELEALVREARLLTLVGIGGVGKTRLATRLARAELAHRPGGVWLVDLSTTKSPELVPQAVATAVGVREEPGRSLVDAIVDALGGARSLLVLDGCERLVAAAAELATEVVRRTREASVLVTSREPLGVAGEAVWQVPPLGVPEEDTDAAGSDAVALFVDRAHLRDRRFVLDARSVELVARICRRLDGIPLAIELAAARTHVLSLEQILEKLGDRFRLLTSGDRTSVARHQTLRATIDWSYDLLADEERRAFERLGVFAGGFTLDAAECVAELDDALDAVTRLVDKSLVVADARRGETRFRMLETVRDYALERLRASGDEAQVRARFLDWVIALAEREQRLLNGPEQGAAMDRIAAELGNVRAATRRALEGEEWAACARLCWALLLFWTTRGYVAEGTDLARAVVTSATDLPEGPMARALHALGSLELYRAEHASSEAHLERSLELSRRSGDARTAASTSRMLGTVVARRGDLTRARALLESSLAAYRAEGDEPHVAWVLSGLGVLAMDGGDLEGARARLEEAIPILRRTGATRQLASALHNLGDVALQAGEVERARTLLGEALELAEAVDDRLLTSVTHLLLGHAALESRDVTAADGSYARAAETSRAIGDQAGVAAALDGSARAALAAGNPARAIELLDEASSVREANGLTAPAGEREAADDCRRASERALGV